MRILSNRAVVPVILVVALVCGGCSAAVEDAAAGGERAPAGGAPAVHVATAPVVRKSMPIEIFAPSNYVYIEQLRLRFASRRAEQAEPEAMVAAT
jgi:hypothetical protein